MNLDELQSVQARERQSSDLQHLRSSFYREVGEFIGELTEKRAQAVEAADDPFSEPEVRRLSDDIETAEGTVEAIYERRVGKVVKKASIAAAGMPVEEDGLTNEEAALFDDLVDRIERNRETVLSVLDGDAPSVSCSVEDSSETAATSGSGTRAEDRNGRDPETPPEPGVDDGTGGPDGISAADLMGNTGDRTRADDDRDGATEHDRPAVGGELSAGPGEATAEPDHTTAERPEEAAGSDHTPDVPSVETVSTESSDGSAPPEISGQSDSADGADPSSPPDAADDPDTGSEAPGVPRTTVRITAEVGEIVGADDRDYDLGSEDVVTLPEPNADVLVEKGAAERF